MAPYTSSDSVNPSPESPVKMQSDSAQVQYLENVIPTDLDDPHRAALENNPEKIEKISISTILAVVSLAFSYLCPLCFGFLLPASTVIQIGTDLGDVEHITWMVGGWSIASSVSFSLAGSLSDIFGRRYTVITGEVISIVGAIIACTAKSTLTLVAASTILGFGCGIVFVSYAGISELLPNKYRGTGIGFTETVQVFPWAIAGTLFATLFAERIEQKWRWSYYIGIIYGVISLIGTALFYYPPWRPQYDFEKSRWQEIKEIDYVGFLLYTSGLTVFLIGLTWGGTAEHPWKSVSTLVPLILGIFLLICCFIYDFTIPKMPFFPLQLFRQVREFTLLLVVVFISGMVYYSMTALLPQGSLFMYSNDPIQIGVMALPMGAALAIFAGILTLLIGIIGHLRLQIITGLIIQTIFLGLFAAIVPHHKGAWMAFMALAMGPFGLVTLVCYVVVGLNVPLRHLGIASGLLGTFRSAGGSVGNAIFNSILQSQITKQLPTRIAQAGISNGLDSSSLLLLIPATIQNAVGVPQAFAAVPGITPAIEAAAAQALKDAYGYAYSRVFLATIPFGVVAIVCAACIKDPSIYLTNHTAVHMEMGGIRQLSKKEKGTEVDA